MKGMSTNAGAAVMGLVALAGLAASAGACPPGWEDASPMIMHLQGDEGEPSFFELAPSLEGGVLEPMGLHAPLLIGQMQAERAARLADLEQQVVQLRTPRARAELDAALAQSRSPRAQAERRVQRKMVLITPDGQKHEWNDDGTGSPPTIFKQYGAGGEADAAAMAELEAELAAARSRMDAAMADLEARMSAMQADAERAAQAREEAFGARAPRARAFGGTGTFTPAPEAPVRALRRFGQGQGGGASISIAPRAAEVRGEAVIVQPDGSVQRFDLSNPQEVEEMRARGLGDVRIRSFGGQGGGARSFMVPAPPAPPMPVPPPPPPAAPREALRSKVWVERGLSEVEPEAGNKEEALDDRIARLERMLEKLSEEREALRAQPQERRRVPAGEVRDGTRSRQRGVSFLKGNEA